MKQLVDVIVPTLVGVLLAITVGATIAYYRLIRRAQAEYEKAKDIVEDVVLSFNRELHRETEKLDVIAYKIEGNSAKIEAGVKKIEVVKLVFKLSKKRNKSIEIAMGIIRYRKILILWI